MSDGGWRGSFLFFLFVFLLIFKAGAADNEESHEQKYAGDDSENNIHGLKRFDGGEIDHAPGDDEYGDMHHHSVFFG